MRVVPVGAGLGCAEDAEPPVQHGGGGAGAANRAHPDRLLHQGVGVVAGEGNLANLGDQAWRELCAGSIPAASIIGSGRLARMQDLTPALEQL